MAWFAENQRPLPWKGVKDPYLIWLSEIILQQTRIAQGLPYYERFRKKYPRIGKLAIAPEDEIMKLWEGLGYYSRARNMHQTAKFIAGELNGIFPDTYERILALKGVGPYTAAAIASFAFGLAYAVLDGNVFRVLSRFFAIEDPIDSSGGKKKFAQIAQKLIDPMQPGAYNQAIMDFGALLCTPQNPNCTHCPLRKNCRALQLNAVNCLPVKWKKINRKERFFHYLVINQNKKVWLNKRMGKDIWKSLYEFPLIELPELAMDEKKIIQSTLWQKLIGQSPYSIRGFSRPFKQLLTHQKIIAHFWKIELPDHPNPPPGPFMSAELKNLNKFAFPKIIDCYLRDNSLYL